MSYKMLIVDDEEANLRTLDRLFREEYTVFTASSGAEALRLLEQHDVAILITDQRMPEMTGLELLGNERLEGAGKCRNPKLRSHCFSGT